MKSWAAAVSECKRGNGNILDYAETYLGVSTVPGFSDVINGNQPLWMGVIYLRYPKSVVFLQNYDMKIGKLMTSGCEKLYTAGTAE